MIRVCEELKKRMVGGYISITFQTRGKRERERVGELRKRGKSAKRYLTFKESKTKDTVATNQIILSYHCIALLIVLSTPLDRKERVLKIKR